MAKPIEVLLMGGWLMGSGTMH